MIFISVEEDVQATGQRLSNDKHQTEHSRAVADPQVEMLTKNFDNLC